MISKKEIYIKVVEIGMSQVTKLSPALNIKIRYFKEYGKKINLKEPVNFIEKLCYLKLNEYNNNLLVKRCSDKLAVRNYVKEKGYGNLLNQIYHIYDKPEEIDFDKLPTDFALKYNIGCGYNIICPNKDEINSSDVLRKLKKWEKEKYWLANAEMQYKECEKKIICEKYLKTMDGVLPIDYKFYVFNGKVKAVLVISDRDKDEKYGAFYDEEWNYINCPNDTYKVRTFLKPEGFEIMKECAESLAEPFPFVRVDFYQINNKVIFGEMTFTPGGAVYASHCRINNKDMGELLKIER